MRVDICLIDGKKKGMKMIGGSVRNQLNGNKKIKMKVRIREARRGEEGRGGEKRKKARRGKTR